MDDATEAQPGRPAPGRLAIFTYEQAPEFFQTDMLTQLGGSPETLESYQRAWEDGQADASTTHVLFRHAGEAGVSLLHVWQKPGKVTPRHSHDGDCLYYVIAGALHMGNRVLGPGDGFFVPAGHPYSITAGDEGAELLEFRPTTTSFDMQVRDQAPEKWEAFAEEVRAGKERWAGQAVPPSRRHLDAQR